MKIRIITLLILVVAFIGGFLSFEKKKGEYRSELNKIRSVHDKIILNQSRIEGLKKKRAEYFKKVFMINRPGDINRSLTGFISVLIMMDNHSVRFSEINIMSRTGTLEFEISGFSNKSGGLLDLSDKLESSAGAFIISKKVGDLNPRKFILKGEVAVE